MLAHPGGQDDHEDEERHRAGHGEVAGGDRETVGAVVRHDAEREQPEQVREEDEEEDRPHQREVATALLRTEPRVDDLVSDPDEPELEQREETGLLRRDGHLSSGPGEHADHQDAAEDQEELMRGDRPQQVEVEELIGDVCCSDDHADPGARCCSIMTISAAR